MTLYHAAGFVFALLAMTGFLVWILMGKRPFALRLLVGGTVLSAALAIALLPNLVAAPTETAPFLLLPYGFYFVADIGGRARSAAIEWDFKRRQDERDSYRPYLPELPDEPGEASSPPPQPRPGAQDRRD